jgi:hypothetical protein
MAYEISVLETLVANFAIQKSLEAIFFEMKPHFLLTLKPCFSSRYSSTLICLTETNFRDLRMDICIFVFENLFAILVCTTETKLSEQTFHYASCVSEPFLLQTIRTLRFLVLPSYDALPANQDAAFEVSALIGLP